jgi:hypothetical protein
MSEKIEIPLLFDDDGNASIDLVIGAWADGRPDPIYDLAKEFIPGSKFVNHVDQSDGSVVTENLWLIGFTEGGQLIFSTINPFENFKEAIANKSKKRYINSEDFRKSTERIQ